jgi:hypothetical protein
MSDSSDHTTIAFRRLRAAPLPEAPHGDDGTYVPVLTIDGTAETVTWDEGFEVGDLSAVEDDVEQLQTDVTAAQATADAALVEPTAPDFAAIVDANVADGDYVIVVSVASDVASFALVDAADFENA